MKQMTLQSARQIKQVGLSIVEFMVAILIGLIVLAGVLQVMMSSKTTFVNQEEMSYIQENARFALDIIGRDILAAGFRDCAGANSNVAIVARVGNANQAPLLGAAPVMGYEGSANGATPALYANDVWVPGHGGTDRPDSIIVRRSDGIPQPLQIHDGNSLTVAEGSQFAAGDYASVVAEDCRRSGVFQIATVVDETISYSNGTVCTSVIKPKRGESIICDAACNCTGDTSFTQNYLPGSTVQNYSASAYYVGSSSAVANQPALKRVRLANGGVVTEELAMGVEDLEITYGVDTNNDGAVDSYRDAQVVTAGDLWGQVYAVRVGLLFRSQSASMPNAETDPILGNTYPDRFMRQEVTATYRLRNRT